MFEILTLTKSGFFIFAYAPILEPKQPLGLPKKIPHTARRLFFLSDA